MDPLPISAPDLGAELFAAPPGFCPKCIARLQGSTCSCPACGLAFRNFRLEDHLPGPVLGRAWRELLPAWGERGAHRAFIALAQREGELVGAARLYRLQRARDPQDAVAARGLDEIVRVALAPTQLVRRCEAPEAGRGRARGAWAVLACGLLAVAAAPFVLGLIR